MKTRIRLIRLDKKAKLPSAAEGDVGYDLRSTMEGRIMPGETVMIKTGLQLAAPPELVFENDEQPIPVIPYLKIEGRSGMAFNSIFPVGGIIDPSYRGEINVLLYNGKAVMGDPNKSAYDIKVGDKIAQLVIYPVFATRNNLIETKFEYVRKDNIRESTRGMNGFGSTGR